MNKRTKKVLAKVTKRFLSVAMVFALLTTMAPATVHAAGVGRVESLSAEIQAQNVMRTLEVEELKAEVITEIEQAPGNHARTMLVDCNISICFSEAGMHLEISTGTVGDASVIGVKDIEIMKKVWYGWKTVAYSDGGEVNDRSMMGVEVLYANAEKDETYRVTCVHYATVTNYEEVANDTGAFVFTY